MSHLVEQVFYISVECTASGGRLQSAARSRLPNVREGGVGERPTSLTGLRSLTSWMARGTQCPPLPFLDGSAAFKLALGKSVSAHGAADFPSLCQRWGQVSSARDVFRGPTDLVNALNLEPFYRRQLDRRTAI